ILIVAWSFFLAPQPGTTQLPEKGRDAENQVPKKKFFRSKEPIQNRYIVALKRSLVLSGLKTSQQDITSKVRFFADDVARSYGGQRQLIYDHVLKGFTVEMSEANAIALSKDPRIEFVEEDGWAYLSADQDADPAQPQVQNPMIHQSQILAQSSTTVHVYV